MVDWLEWDADVFARAARERRPVLLSITAAWCGACHEMDRTTYANPGVSTLIREAFVPIRVDTDRRPDINDRYNLGGWPTTAFLTPAGELMTGGTFVSVERMPGVLSRVAAAFHENAAILSQGSSLSSPSSVGSSGASGSSGPAGPAGPAGAAGERVGDPSDAIVREASGPHPVEADVVEQIYSTFDVACGGFGTEPKFPLTPPLHLAIALFEETREDRWRAIAETTLDAMADGGLWDCAAGGFHRYATRRDWQLPHREKLLETNASLLRVYAEAARAFGRPVDLDRTCAIARFITTVLRAESGGYHGSDADTILYADANAIAARGLLAAGALLEDPRLVAEAVESFERVLLACYKPGGGVAHFFDGAARVRGLLTDQIGAIHALLDAHEITDREPYSMMAEEIGSFVARDMWDPDAGGCFDRAAASDDVGLLRSRRKPLAGNAEAAVAFARLDRLAHEVDFRPLAAGALRAAALAIEGQGPLAAHYVLAARQLR